MEIWWIRILSASLGLIFCSTCTQIHGHKPLGFAESKCSEAGDPNSIGYRSAIVNWIAGYASGLNVAAAISDEDLQALTAERIFDTVVDSCMRNPSLRLIDAADELLSELPSW